MSLKIRKNAYRVSPYKLRKEGKEYIIFFKILGEYFVVNETGKDILSFFSEASSCELLDDFIRKEYGELDIASKLEIENYLKQLYFLGVLENQ